MNRFRADNTDGYTQADLDELDRLFRVECRKQAQIALAAIDETLSNGSELTSEVPLVAAYNALRAARKAARIEALNEQLQKQCADALRLLSA